MGSEQPKGGYRKLPLSTSEKRLVALSATLGLITICLIVLFFYVVSRQNPPDSESESPPTVTVTPDVAQAPDLIQQTPSSSPEHTFTPTQTLAISSNPTELTYVAPTMTLTYTATTTRLPNTNTPSAATSTNEPDTPTPTAIPTLTPIPVGTATPTPSPSPTMEPTLDPCAVMSITHVIIGSGSSSFYLTNAQMQIIDITRITYSWAAAGPLSQIDLEPEILMTFNPVEPPPIYVNSSQFNQRAPIGFGTRALIFRFSVSSPTAAHTLTIEFDGLCSITHIQ